MSFHRPVLASAALLLALALLLAACQPELKTPAAQAPLPTAQASPTTAPPETPPTLPVGHPSWALVKDPISGISFAAPCWWGVTLPGEDGAIRSITVVNYDRAFFEANSEKGEWIGGQAPEGVIKFDLTIINLEDPGVSDDAFARQFLESDIQSISNIEASALEQHPALKVQVRSTVNGEESVVYLMRAAPERMVVFAIYPNASLTNIDIRLVLASLALDASQPEFLPEIPPEKPLPGVAPFCQF